jgi:hypothetical protein
MPGPTLLVAVALADTSAHANAKAIHCPGLSRFKRPNHTMLTSHLHNSYQRDSNYAAAHHDLDRHRDAWRKEQLGQSGFLERRIGVRVDLCGVQDPMECFKRAPDKSNLL